MQLAKLPNSMMTYGGNLRELCREQNVGDFGELRKQFYDKSHLFVTKMLPLTDRTINSIQTYMENYKDFTHDQWQKDLEYILKEVKSAEMLCSFLLFMYEQLMIEVNQIEDQAIIKSGLTKAEIQSLTQLIQSSEKAKQSGEKLRSAGVVTLCIGVGVCLAGCIVAAVTVALAPVTAGASLVYGGSLVTAGAGLVTEVTGGAIKAAGKAKTTSAEKELSTNIDQKRKAVMINMFTSSGDEFRASLRACSSFFATTRPQLESMIQTGETPERKTAFKKMKFKAEEILESCGKWTSSVTQVSKLSVHNCSVH